jgi:hypothetical protein
LVLARHDDTRRDVSDPHRGVGDVHVLAPGPGRAVRVDAQVVRIDVRQLRGIEGRDGVERRERSLAARIRVGMVTARAGLPLQAATLSRISAPAASRKQDVGPAATFLDRVDLDVNPGARPSA